MSDIIPFITMPPTLVFLALKDLIPELERATLLVNRRLDILKPIQLRSYSPDKPTTQFLFQNRPKK